MIPLWAGMANTWDCDEMGHMNVRIYAEKSLEGFGAFASAIGLPDAFKPRAISTLIPAEAHIRFIREIHVGHGVKMAGCVLSYDETSVWLYQEMRHADGSCAASFRTKLYHAEARTGKIFPWSEATKAQLDKLIDTPPDDAKPRGIDIQKQILSDDQASLSTADSVGAPEIGRGMVPLHHCDVFGRMLTSWFIGRISDSVTNLIHGWRDDVAKALGDRNLGAAALEYRLIYRAIPQPGDQFVMRSSLGGAEGKTKTFVHWILDPVTGHPWMTCEAVVVTFDLDARKAVTVPKEQIDMLKAIAPAGLTI